MSFSEVRAWSIRVSWPLHARTNCRFSENDSYVVVLWWCKTWISPSHKNDSFSSVFFIVLCFIDPLLLLICFCFLVFLLSTSLSRAITRIDLWCFVACWWFDDLNRGGAGSTFRRLFHVNGNIPKMVAEATFWRDLQDASISWILSCKWLPVPPTWFPFYSLLLLHTHLLFLYVLWCDFPLIYNFRIYPWFVRPSWVTLDIRLDNRLHDTRDSTKLRVSNFEMSPTLVHLIASNQHLPLSCSRQTRIIEWSVCWW